ncbi:insecticidal delta-endotoxin Cry8Ea1 family protein [Bacillus cereus group sp. Bc222]|uniref:insecticidal delta-endotoxin Cry8Ea1 family protein n=1 Tax=Bacillus cereus group sp. Bc222 TaxID=3018111 RepID=UPI0022E6D003|nr:insecticidal delta-endotoxin Cry8Ea1 family protein [Bacillus cereus group sp. Bc222]MDA2241741.1 insecticidal delta-endotoxin Cry8Ea1 family protein [Bacillus cereus group sp. Bc222]
MKKNKDTSYNPLGMATNLGHKINRYPLANNQVSKLKGTNYKDSLVMCNNANPVWFHEPENLEFTWLNAAVAALTVVSTITALLVAPPIVVGGVVAAGAAILAGTLPLLWPAGEPTKDNTFDELMGAAEKLIKKEISEFVRQTAGAKIESLRQLMNHYQSALEYWKKNPNNQAAIYEVSSRFRIVNAFFVEAMSALSVKGYETVQLSAYAQAANLHLLLLKDGITYANAWSLAYESSGNPGDLHYREFIDFRREYINYCSKWYNEGFIDAENKLVYQTAMTIYVLDIIALFSAYDVRQYKYPLKMETLTRTLYTHLLSENGKQFKHKPSLFRKLKKIKLYTYKGSSDSWLCGQKNVYETMNFQLIEDKVQGSTSDINNTLDFGSGGAYSVTTNIKNNDPINIQKMTFYAKDHGENLEYTAMDSGNTIEFKRNIPNIDAPSRNLNTNKYTHYLSDCIIDTEEKLGSKSIKSYTFGWNHHSIDSTGNYVTDVIDPKETNSPFQISQIPAVKASHLSSKGSAGGVSVFNGPYFTGGDVILSKVKVNNNESITGKTTMNITLPLVPKGYRTRSFRIRMYYAANHDGSIKYKYKEKSGEATFKKTFDRYEPYKIKFEDFQYLDFDWPVTFDSDGTLANVNLTWEYIHSYIQGQGEKLLMIDKFEFIPIETH